MLLSELEFKRAVRDPAVAERPNPQNTRSYFTAEAGYTITIEGGMVAIAHSGRVVRVPFCAVTYGYSEGPLGLPLATAPLVQVAVVPPRKGKP